MDLHNEKTGFYCCSGRAFMDPQGQPCRVRGVNMWYAMYLGASGPGGDRERLVRELDALGAAGVNNLRVLAGGTASRTPGAVSPALIRHPGNWNEELLDGLDFLLAELARRKMGAVLYFGNFWHWSGGFTRWTHWAECLRRKEAGNGGPVPDWDGLDPAADPHTPGVNYQLAATAFYADAGAVDLFLAHFEVLLKRRNRLTGRLYRDEPGIFAWQLANEPRGGEGSPRREGYGPWREWIRRTAGLIRSCDGNHMISTGSEGAMGCAESLEAWERAHDIPDIDYMCAHIWPKNWTWWKNPTPGTQEFEAGIDTVCRNSLTYLDEHLAVADRLGKPLVLEEFGLGRDREDCSPDAPARARNRYFRQLFSQIASWQDQGRAMGGYNVWSWGGECRPARGEGPVSPWLAGDPFCGDPPQEPQGLNSVFSTDTETLGLIGGLQK